MTQQAVEKTKEIGCLPPHLNHKWDWHTEFGQYFTAPTDWKKCKRCGLKITNKK